MDNPRIPSSFEDRPLESPTLRTGDSLSFTATVTTHEDGRVECENHDAWVMRADDALERFPDAF